MFDCLKKKQIPAAVLAPPIIGPVRFAIIVGHNKREQGAVNYFGESEYSYNCRIAQKLQQAMADNGFAAITILRPAGLGYSEQCKSVAKACNKWGISHTLNLHFNSYKSAIDGCECLVADTKSSLDNELGIAITDRLLEEYGIPKRGNNGIQTILPEHRGGDMLYTLEDTGILPVIVEPLFANFRTDKTKLFFESEDKYVDLLSRSILAVRSGSY